jgi:hypothetical protein
MTEFYLKISQHVYAKLPVYIDRLTMNLGREEREKNISFRNEYGINSICRIFLKDDPKVPSDWLALYFNDIESMMNFQLQYL